MYATITIITMMAAALVLKYVNRYKQVQIEKSILEIKCLFYSQKMK
jgi:hypothetical protein